MLHFEVGDNKFPLQKWRFKKEKNLEKFVEANYNG